MGENDVLKIKIEKKIAFFTLTSILIGKQVTPVKFEPAIVFTGHFYEFYQFFIDFGYFLRRAEPFLGGIYLYENDT